MVTTLTRKRNTWKWKAKQFYKYQHVSPKKYNYMSITITNWKYGSFLLTSRRQYLKNSPTQTFKKYPPPFQPLYTTLWDSWVHLFLLSEDSAYFSSIWRTLFSPLGLSIYSQRYTDSYIFCNSQDNSSSNKPKLLVVLF